MDSYNIILHELLIKYDNNEYIKNKLKVSFYSIVKNITLYIYVYM